MPRYHFDVHDGVTTLDENGTEFPDVPRARAYARRILLDIAKEDDSPHLAVHVRDDDQRAILTISLVVETKPVVEALVAARRHHR